jgi:hypothetical protein
LLLYLDLEKGLLDNSVGFKAVQEGDRGLLIVLGGNSQIQKGFNKLLVGWRNSLRII